MGSDIQHARSATRHRKALELVRTRFNGVIAHFAAAIDKPPSQVRTWLFPDSAGGRRMGEKMARHIEAKLGLPHDWMDEGNAMPKFQVAELIMRELEAEGVPEQQVVVVLGNLLQIARSSKSRGA